MNMISILILSQFAFAGSCDEKLYDRIYKTIIQQAMRTKLTRKDFIVRNRTIENLRKLCKGQRSSYETH